MLRREEIAFYRAQGYLVVEGLLDAADLSQVRLPFPKAEVRVGIYEIQKTANARFFAPSGS